MIVSYALRRRLKDNAMPILLPALNENNDVASENVESNCSNVDTMAIEEEGQKEEERNQEKNTNECRAKELPIKRLWRERRK